MPREVYLLSDAVRLGQVLTARCGACGRQRHFNAEDWMRILGDVPVYRVATELKCSSCDTNDHLRVRVPRAHGVGAAVDEDDAGEGDPLRAQDRMGG